jgi:1-deoxy-D-xylulose-5-phosphate reductoisomerase
VPAEKKIVILGSTGSIGVQALEIIEANPDKFQVVGLAAGGKSSELLKAQATKFGVKEFGEGIKAATEIAAINCDLVLNGITGSIGLGPTLSALSSGNKLALANKESLVAGGELVMKYGRENIIPVDSEHSAIYQSMKSGKLFEVKKLVLTASGGPFRNREDLTDVTVEDALAHPTWNMGQVVTINSATLVNKGLEIIEAHYLFDMPYKKIEAVIHPQSIIHSMVEFIDGSTIAQASPPNMKGPIAYALGGSDRVPDAMPAINWSKSQNWEFTPIDESKFPALRIAREVGELGSAFTAIFNAANEVAVESFLNRSLSFTKILKVVESTVERMSSTAPKKFNNLDDVSAVEQDARMIATEMAKGA